MENSSSFDLTPIQRTMKMSGALKLLEGARAEIAQRRMPPLTVVPNFNIVKDRPASCCAGCQRRSGEFHVRADDAWRGRRSEPDHDLHAGQAGARGGGARRPGQPDDHDLPQRRAGRSCD